MYPARIFPSLVKALGFRVSEAAFGMSTPGLLASYDRDTQSWKTSELSLFGDSIEYSGRWPRSGTMRSGKIYAPPMSERPTVGKESGLWRTPTLGMLNADRAKDPEYGNRKAAKGQTITLADQVRPSLATMARKGLWPTPTGGDAKASGSAGYSTASGRHTGATLTDATVRADPSPEGGSLNPVFVEWLMGYPLGWTDLKASGIRLSLKSRN
jgi:hypothetical protein